MQGDDVRGPQKLVVENEAHAEGVFLILGETLDVVVLDLHVEAGRAARDLLADVAEADDTERGARQLVDAHFGGIPHAPVPRDDVVVELHEPLVDGEHQHDRVLGHGDGVGAAVVGDGNLRLPRRLAVDLVVAGARELHELELRRRAEELVTHPPGEAEIVLGLRGRFVKLRRVEVGREQLEAGRRERTHELHDHRRLFRAEEDLVGHR